MNPDSKKDRDPPVSHGGLCQCIQRSIVPNAGAWVNRFLLAPENRFALRLYVYAYLKQVPTMNITKMIVTIMLVPITVTHQYQ